MRTGCGSSAVGVGVAFGAGYRLRPGLRAEGRLGVFGQPQGETCVAAVDAPQPSPPPRTTYRTTEFDTALRDGRGFGQGRLVAEFGNPDTVVRLAIEAERWWMSSPVADRTTVWEARTGTGGTTYSAPSTTERHFRRDLHVTWARFGATIPLPGT